MLSSSVDEVFDGITREKKITDALLVNSIMRILFMVPVYCAESFLCFYFYQKSVYFEVLGTCYEAFALSSFFTLLCHYAAPDLHTQKEYFRGIRPKEWLMPVNWLAKCCGGQRGIWRTPRSGLTWFNVSRELAKLAQNKNIFSVMSLTFGLCR